MEKFEHGGQVYDADGKAGDWLDFSANINPLGLSEKVRAALAENLAGVVNYPDPAAVELKAAICARYAVKPENLVLLNGAAEFFYLYLNATRPRRVVIPVPSFSEYERAARAAGADVEYFYLKAEKKFALDVEKIPAADCVILGRPNNPTGTLPTLDEIQALAEKSCVLVDESFIDFLPVESARRLVSEKILVVQSLTKIFAIPGLRLGFAVVEEKLAARLNLAKDVWNVNFLAQKAGVAALADEEYLAETLSWLAAEREFFLTRLKKLRGVEVVGGAANFVLVRLERAPEVLEELRRRKILVRSCANFAGLDERFLRVAVRSRAENLRLLENLEAIL
ncbi:MAG: threonine-phosphate decarboxylase [Selenomonadaceae bacterium]|nr:threonine-phosphate decarboxylase [Selenomonadaceae bacterium]